MSSVQSIAVGSLDFQVIHIDPADVAQALQSFVSSGSKLTGVSLDDISTSVIRLPAESEKITLVLLLELGMKLFDAIVWLSAGNPTTHSLEIDSQMNKDDIPSLHSIAKSVFYVYFFVLTQARYPAASGDSEKPKVPNFLSKIMGLDKGQSHYIELLCTFPPQQFDNKWVQHINFAGLGQEALARFGLGVAGYRMFGPFKLYAPRDNLSAELKNACEFASNVSRAPPTWGVHPSTRDPTVLTRRGNLNKNLGNLILDVFTEEQIDEMVATKVLYRKPVREAAARNYLQWSPIDDISGPKQIFRT